MADSALGHVVNATYIEAREEAVDRPAELVLGHRSDSVDTVSRGSAIFREMLDDTSEPIPTYEELERFGLFDLDDCAHRLAEYRLKHPLPTPPASFVVTRSRTDSDPEDFVTRRPRPTQARHRHSVAIVPLSSEALQQDPPVASPSFAVRANPFNLVRRATVRPRPSRAARSTGDMPLASDIANVVQKPQRLSPDLATTYKPRPLSLHVPSKDSREARRLRKQAPPKVSLRTDDEYLLRPFADSPNAHQTERPSLKISMLSPALSTGSPRPSNSRRQSWRSGTSSFVSSPLAYESTVGDPFECPRSPSPIANFPSGVQREMLPPVERKKRDSSMSSSESMYLADSERTRNSPLADKASSRFSVSRPPSPTGSGPMGSVWSRALKLSIPKTRRNGSRPSSVASFDSPTTPGEESMRSFEVLGRRPSPRPVSEASDGALRDTAETVDKPDQLDRIVEQPETPDKRAAIAPVRSLSHADSAESLPVSSGGSTPAVLSASSSMTTRHAATTSGRPAMPRSRGSSNLVLASTSSSCSLAEAYARQPASAPPTKSTFPSTSSLSLGDSWQRSPSSHSRSQDSLFYSSSEMPPPDGEDEFTGASSAHDDEDDEAALALDERRRRMARKHALPPVLAAPVVID